MDAGAATESRPEPPQGLYPARDSSDETASETLSLGRSSPNTEYEATSAELERVSAGNGPAPGDGDEPDLAAQSQSILDKCIKEGRFLQELTALEPLSFRRWDRLVNIGRSAKQAIESYQDANAIGAGGAATAEPKCQNGHFQENPTTLVKFRDDQHKLLERTKQILGIYVSLCDEWSCEPQNDESENYERPPGPEDEESMVTELLVTNTSLQGQILKLQNEKKRLQMKLESKIVFGRQHGATLTDEDDTEEIHRWEGPTYDLIRDAERQDETPKTRAATPGAEEGEEEDEAEEEEQQKQQQPPPTQRREDESWQAQENPGGRQSPDGSIGSEPREEATYESLPAQRKSSAAEPARDAESSDETAHWVNMAEIHYQKVQHLEGLVKELQQDREDITTQGERCYRRQPQRDSMMMLFQPQSLALELGNSVDSPAYMHGSPVSGFGGFGGFEGRGPEPGFEEAHNLLKEQCQAWKEFAIFLAFILLQTWHAPGRIMYNNRRSFKKVPLLKSVDWDRWEPAAQREKPFRAKALLRALRHIVILFSLHAYLSCRWERDIWLGANGLTRRYLTKQLHHLDGQWWPVPGVDPGVVWQKGMEMGALVAMQMVDVWAEWLLRP